MFRVAAELKDVPLRDAQVLQQLPGAVRRAQWFHSAQTRGEIRHRAIEVRVRIASPQEV